MKSLDVQVGAGRVPWADATTLRDAVYLPAGWALPGGLRTDDRERALVVAENIAALIVGRLPKAGRGFTLIEALIVLAIVLILVAIALPALRGEVCVRKETRTQLQMIGKSLYPITGEYCVEWAPKKEPAK